MGDTIDILDNLIYSLLNLDIMFRALLIPNRDLPIQEVIMNKDAVLTLHAKTKGGTEYSVIIKPEYSEYLSLKYFGDVNLLQEVTAEIDEQLMASIISSRARY